MTSAKGRTAILQIALLVALPILALWPVLSAQFATWDDLATVGQNPLFDPVSWKSVAHYWQHSAMDLYVPVTYTVWAALAWLAQGSPVVSTAASSLNPALFHAANLVVHVLSTLVVFGILRRILRQDWPAVIGALLFALHPVQVESVAWVSGMKDVLSGFLALAAVWCHIRRLSTEDDARARAWFGVATLAFVLALLAKPSAVVVPLVVLVVVRWAMERSWSVALRGVAPWLAISAVFAVLTVIIQPAPHLVEAPLWTRPFIAGDALGFYLSQLLLPLNLAVDYGRTPHSALAHWSGYAAGIVPLGLLIALWFSRKRTPVVWAGALVFCAALIPVLGFVGFDFQRYSTVGDHYLYVAMLGPALVAGVLLCRAPPWGVPVACVALVLLGVKSHVQTRSWQTSRAL